MPLLKHLPWQHLGLLGLFNVVPKFARRKTRDNIIQGIRIICVSFENESIWVLNHHSLRHR